MYGMAVALLGSVVVVLVEGEGRDISSPPRPVLRPTSLQRRLTMTHAPPPPQPQPQQKRAWFARLRRPSTTTTTSTTSTTTTTTKPATERTSLLGPKPPTTSAPISALPSPPELLHLLRSSIPIILAYALQNSLQTTSILIIGRRSPAHLSAAAFSYMFAMSTGWLIALGGTTALDTLCSAAFTASRSPQPHALGVLLQRAFLVLGAMYIPVCALWWFSAPLFMALGQEAALAADAQGMLRALVPGGLGYIYFEALKKYLQAQGIHSAGTAVLCVTAPLSVLLNHLSATYTSLDLRGAALATGAAYWASFLLLVAYARYIRGSAGWGGWDLRAACSNVGPFAKLAALGVVMVGTEWWAFEIVALAAGRLGAVPLAAQSVVMTTDQVLNTVPFGIGVAASTRVGHMLGARDARGAARAAHSAAWLSVLAGAAVGGAMMVARHSYGRLFSDDTAVVSLVARVMPYVAAFQVADGLNGSCGGALRGMGRQHVGAAVNVGAYYAAALPGGIWLAFWRGWGLEGLWVGQCCALFVVGLAEWTLVGCSDWREQVVGAFGRMDEGDRAEVGGLVEGDEGE
ncbi:mate-domain-containing protein [Geopyxis carbonaria]|nr:mate-domain-containing protein [Geopyxis carbonaria]